MAVEPREPAEAPVSVVGSAPTIGRLGSLVGYALRRAQLRISADLAESLGTLKLRPATFSVLAVIDENRGLGQSALGELLGIQRANFVPLAAELERRGWIERRPSSQDLRRNILHLTVEGRRVLDRGWRMVRSHERRIERTLGRLGYRRLHELLVALASGAAADAQGRAASTGAAS